MQTVKMRQWARFLPVVFTLIVFAGFFTLIAPSGAFAAGGDITISGPGLNNPDPITITQKQLRGEEPLSEVLQKVYGKEYLDQHDEWYSTINTWPTKRWYRGQGVKLTDLLKLAGGLNENANQIRFTSKDGFKATFTVQELINEPRYRFPNFMDTGIPGHLPGDPSDAMPVEPMIAHISCNGQDLSDVMNNEYLSSGDANLLLYGQQAVTQQTNAKFSQKVAYVEVLTDVPLKWNKPSNKPVSGEVSLGTLVKLESEYNDEDKIHYTLDGSEPTIESPMYNWIASRWWSSRSDELDEINHPIEIIDNTTIKAFVTGPGKLDSDVEIFDYKVPLTITQGNLTHALLNEPYKGYKFTAVGGEKPYSFEITEGTLPEGMSLNGAVLEGTPTEFGTFTFTVTVTDSIAKAASHDFILVVKPLTIGQDNPPNAILNEEYTGHTFTAADGVEPYRFTITEGSLPEGMILTGPTLQGIPIESGTFPFTVTVTDSSDPVKTDSHEFSLLVASAPPILAADATDNKVGQTIELTFSNDENWCQGITDIEVNGNSIKGKYEIVNGVITIVPDVFTAAGDYNIAVIAAGYFPVIVTQKVIDDGGSNQPKPEDIVLTITGDGVASPKKFTQSQLEAMPQHQEVYSCINTWPSKKWYVGKGVKLRDLLNSAGMQGNAQQIKFYGSDGYCMTFTVQELLKEKRYCFPNFKSGGGDADGHIPGSSSGATIVEPILALVSAEGTDNPADMNAKDALLFMLGQRAVTEQTGPLFAKKVNEIEILTDSPDSWDEPTADPDSGTVPAGTKVKLHSPYDDMDKVYYTTDGSTPTINSPMYNRIASRWWKDRTEVLDTINKPIVLTKDTTIKAITIGPGKLNSDMVEFTYKVTATPDNTSDKITPGEGGKVSLGEEAVIEIPAEALNGTNPVEVKIERVSEPPVAPAGLSILGSVYEFCIADEINYSFKKPVTIKLTFNAEEIDPDASLAVFYYDQTAKKWINIGGEVSDNTVTVEVDHLTMFALMVVDKPEVIKIIKPAEGGKVNLGEEITIDIPAGALVGTSPVEVKIERVSEPPAAPAEFKIIAGVYELSMDGQTQYNFKKPVTINLTFDSEKVESDKTPFIYFYDEIAQKWVNIGGEVSNNIITVQVNHFTKYTVMAESEVNLTDIRGHWAEEYIKELVARKAISGYPDGTFKPDNNITRAEFISILVKAFDLKSQSGKDFVDTIGHWAQEAISAAAYHGVVKGYDGNIFGPDEYISREQMAVMIVKSAKLAPVIAELSFTDSSSISGWAKEPLVTAEKNGIINGYPDKTLRPQNNASRAEAATVIVNALHMKIDAD